MLLEHCAVGADLAGVAADDDRVEVLQDLRAGSRASSPGVAGNEKKNQIASEKEQTDMGFE